jgi:hypothetical protein
MGDYWNEPRDKGPTEKIESLAEESPSPARHKGKNQIGRFCELRPNAVLRSCLRRSSGGIMFVVEREIPRCSRSGSRPSSTSPKGRSPPRSRSFAPKGPNLARLRDTPARI